MNDPGMNEILKWGIENSEAGRPTDGSAPRSQLNPELLAQLMGGPSDADRMVEAMQAVHSPDVDLENKMIAWDNFEQMVENLDNANNMAALNLWVPLMEKLDDKEAEARTMACWCMGTAVQNNIKCQEQALAIGAIPKIIKLVLEDQDAGVRKKAIRVLSSEIRNYQPGLDEAVKHLPAEIIGVANFDAGDMESVDGLIQSLRDHFTKTS